MYLSGELPRLQLRPIEVDDHPLLFRWYGDVSLPHFWNFHRRILAYRGFVEQLGQLAASMELRLICLVPTGEPIGYCQGYDLRPWDGFAYFTMYLTPEHRYAQEPTEAAMPGLNMLFSTYPLRKVYSEVYGFASYVQAALEALGFVEEGITPNHYWFRDRFWPRVRLAIYRERWQELRAASHNRMALSGGSGAKPNPSAGLGGEAGDEVT